MPEPQVQQTEELAKDLGLLEALTIGIGVMIGAGIFILPRFAIGRAGPAAVLAYLLAGVIAMISAASTAEVATGMPKSGGLYYFISRALGTFWGTIAGVALWLSLSFAVAFYLQGFGEYLARLLPFDASHIAIAVVVGAAFIAINYRGVKESGSTQNLITVALLVILIGFVGWGVFRIDAGSLTPFFPYGTREILPVTALVFVSFIGFGEIAAVAEEIKDPGRNVPLALFGSVIIPTLLYVGVILVAAGVLPMAGIIDMEAPIVEAARLIAGAFGALAVTCAALMATASSANASVLASSRISFAMGRDGILPQTFNQIHKKLVTPHKAIVITGAITIVLVLVADVESLSSSAGVLTLVNYALVNVALIVFRMKPPDDYRPSFTVPGYPYLPILGAILSGGVIILAGRTAQIGAAVLLVLSLGWFALYSRKRSTVEGVSGTVSWREQLSPFRIQDNLTPLLDKSPSARRGGPPAAGFHILTAVANPASGRSLITISDKLAVRSRSDSKISVLNVYEIPKQLPLTSARERQGLVEHKSEIQNALLELSREISQRTGSDIAPRVVYSRNRLKTILNIIRSEDVDFLLLGWRGSMRASRIFSSIVGKLVRNAPCRVGVLKDRGVGEIRKILVPFSGKKHAPFALKLAADFAAADNARITVMRVIGPDDDLERQRGIAEREARKALGDTNGAEYEVKVVVNTHPVDSIVQEANSNGYDLVVVGASKEWSLKNRLFGTTPDVIASGVEPSVLMVRAYDRRISRKVRKERRSDGSEDA